MMRKGRTLFLGGLVSAVAGLVAAPRAGESRRAAIDRLRGSLRRRGGLSAFAGAPCAEEDRTATGGSSPAAGDAGPEGS